ncbi:polypeptide N-acetylgalactosaminyltransferase 15 isoform X2 [Esox lucius]|uniref:polypeptide N-acetylgalactosaminyltransferase 15 isoform X2 n=1 Tax=Esox lucius TaxID=8010 RepID=UPI00147725AD|nr:polypeptide N-acetylgalactosaminyltransferase 15 isoform X2 [Esox lucius]
MMLWSRPRPYRRMILCLWLLILALSVATLMDILFWDETQTSPSSPRRLHHPRLSGPPELEVILDSRDRAKSNHDFGLTPLSSLQEDQLLFVPSTQVRNSASPPRTGSYRVIISSAKKESAVPVLPTHGYMGRPVRLTLGGLESDMEKSALQKYGFNEVVSERISLRRRLPETRDKKCLEERYSQSLPSASVVICFHDEAWSTLLRTVHSVLDTAPKEHLKEVLLVDDLSQHGHLKSVLSEYVSRLRVVRLIRSTRRLGVAGCRSLGAARALGEVLVFMDSHCECHSGWLQPLLERVALDRTRVVSPIIDIIDWQTFQYNATQWPQRGVFDWRLDFYWETLSEQKRQHSPVEPVRSPALAGSVLAIDRHFFQSVGGYDPGMLLWGAEHTELSIRVWLCGGSMEVVPCSRVAHLGRHHPPYLLPDQEILQRNKIRIADIWLEAYRKIYYKRDTLAHFIRQHCELNSLGEVRWGPAGHLCFNAQEERVVVTPCLANQSPPNKPQWRIIKLTGQVIHLQTQRCLEAVNDEKDEQKDTGDHQRGAPQAGLFLRPCAHHPRQQWHFEQLVVP